MTSLQPGQNILHFRVDQKLGEGGMGQVYCAEDLKLERQVAIKVLPWQLRKDEKARQRFFQEARSASKLNHPNIVTIYSIEETEDLDLIVMEYVKGETLSSLIQKGTLDITAISQFGEQVAEALYTAHTSGIIHRDIKSSNILITAQGKVKVLDFGLAKIVGVPGDAPNETPSLTEAGTVLGTVSYMSPEQVRGAELDPQTDLFSLGCVLYEAATGRLPFAGPNPAAIMFQIATVEPQLPSVLRTDLPSQLERIILRALAKDKEHRYLSAQEIARELRKLAMSPTEKFPVLDSRPSFEDSGFPSDGNLVGRESELKRLDQALFEARNGKGRILFVTGEAGIGKTALVNRFLEIARNRYSDLVIAFGQCVESYGSGEAYLPLLDAIGSLISSKFRDRVIGVLRNNAPTWYKQFPAAFDSSGAVQMLQQESAGVTKERMLRELSDALVSFASLSPVILVLEDLHWADPSTVDLLRYMSSRIQRLRILLLTTTRDEDVETKNPPLKACVLELKSHNLIGEIALHTLQTTDVRKYIDLSYPHNNFTPELISLIHRKTEGHPLFVTSLLQFLEEQEILKRTDDRWLLTRPLGEMDLEVPQSVRSMIRKKIDALTEQEKRLLQYASVEGAEFLSIVLSSLSGMDQLTLEEELSRISQAHRMIGEIGEEELPDGSLTTRYRFSHALYQNVLSEDLVSTRRVRLNLQTAEILLQHYGEQASRIAGKLALYFKAGRDHRRAFEYFAIAGNNAVNIFAHLEAASLYRNSLHHLEELLKKGADQTRDWNSSAIEIHEKLGDALALAGNQQEARKQFEKSSIKLAGSNRIVDGRLHRKIAKAWETERNMEEARKEYDFAHNLLKIENGQADSEWWNEWILLHLDQSWLYYTRNELDALKRIVEEVKPGVEKYGTPVQRSRFFQTLLYAAYRRFRYRINEEVLGYAEAALRAARESGDPSQIAVTTFTNGFAALWGGDYENALEKLRDALHQSERVGDAVLQSRCLTYLTVAYRKAGNLDQVRELIPRCFDHCSNIKMEEYVAAAHANRAWLLLREQNVQGAKEDAETAIRIWSSLPLVSPFQSLAVWPLLSINLESTDLNQVLDSIRILLHPNQQRLSDDLNQMIEKTVALLEQSRFEDARIELKMAIAQAQLEKHL